MIIKKMGLIIFLLSLFNYSLFADEVVVGVELKPINTMSLLFTPVVIPDLLSAKMAFEYKLHRKLNLVIPLEAKWMDYGGLFRLIGKTFNIEKEMDPQEWYSGKYGFKPLWDIDISQIKVSSGVGIKYFPFSGSMQDGFFLKTAALIGMERFYLYKSKTNQDSAVLTGNLSSGYTFVTYFNLAFGGEVGVDYIYHTNPPKTLPKYVTPVFFLSGFSPFIQGHIGFVF